MSTSISTYLNGISQSVTNSQVFDKMINSGPGEIPYVTFGMVGISFAALLYVTLTDTAESIGETISETFENIGAFKSTSIPVNEVSSEQQEEEQQKQEEEDKKEVTIGGKKKSKSKSKSKKRRKN